jgi:hypothetical protein
MVTLSPVVFLESSSAFKARSRDFTAFWRRAGLTRDSF